MPTDKQLSQGQFSLTYVHHDNLIRIPVGNIDSLEQDWGISSADAQEITLQSCTKPVIYTT